MVSESIQQRIKCKTETARYEFRAICKNGGEKIIEVLGVGVEIGGKPASFSSILDITERKQAEIKLAESQVLLSSIIDSTYDLVWSVDSHNFGLLTWNRALQDYFLRKRNIKIKAGDTPEKLFPTSEFAQIWCGFYKQALFEEGNYSENIKLFPGKTSCCSISIR